jgi:hypothetical protein
MRDIRSDLQERVGLLEQRIKAAHANCEEKVKQLQNERDATVADLKASIAMLAKLLESEQQHIGDIPPVSLTDFFERKLIEIGPLSKDDLCNLAVKEGYFRDIQSAAQTVEPTLFALGCEKRIRTLPDGTFALPMLSPATRLKQVV